MSTIKNEPGCGQSAQYVPDYFDSIKGNHAALPHFFAALPKGGDIHNHLIGSAIHLRGIALRLLIRRNQGDYL